MKDLKKVDEFIDEREFRNYVSSLLMKKGYDFVAVDDARISDEDPINDNDILVEKKGVKYTVQTFLNVPVGQNEIDETVKDMENEKVSKGIVVTNSKVYDEIKEYASINGIEVFDRSVFENL